MPCEGGLGKCSCRGRTEHAALVRPQEDTEVSATVGARKRVRGDFWPWWVLELCLEEWARAARQPRGPGYPSRRNSTCQYTERGEPSPPLSVVRCLVWLDDPGPNAERRLMCLKEDSSGWREGHP